jgi:hypothetical protein
MGAIAMIKMKVLIVAAILGLGAGARADSIMYTLSVEATGSLDGNPFTDALVTLAGAGDTADISQVVFPGLGPIPGLFDIPVTAQVTVAGLGSATFTDNIVVFVDKIGGDVGFTDNTSFAEILDVSNSALTSYDLAASFGPVSGPPGGTPGESFPTTMNTFEIDAFSGPATFTARAVPEPSSLALAGLGAMALAGYARRRPTESTGS